ncbi:MAG: hypothetical protein WB780_08130 [Candidatus Acidiferrales bacterium]
MSSELSDASRKNWQWPDSLDAVVAAPGNHTVLFENEHVRVLQTRILPRQRTPVHTHRWPSVLFVLNWSDFVRRDELGKVLLDTREGFDVPKLNAPGWLEQLPPHTVENVGDAEINNVQVEIKGAG